MTDPGTPSLTSAGYAGPQSSSEADGSTAGGPLGVPLCATLFVLTFMIAVAGRLANIEALSLGGAFGVVFFGLGAAPFQLAPRLDIYARLAGATLVGFSIVLGLGALMADVQGLWHPVPAAVGLLTVAVVLHALGVVRVRHALRPVLVHWSRSATTMSRPVRISFALMLVATPLWLIPALTTHDPQPGVWGFLPTISPVWFVGLVVLILAFAVGRRGECSAMLSTLSFGLASTLTPALVYGTTRQGAAAKQMLITQAVITGHHLRPQGGIYQAFSALFSGMAWLCQLIHVHGMLGSNSLIGLATYWPVLILFPRICVLRLFTGRLLATPARRWAAVMLVLLVDTINDANYFSPQSTGYILAIGMLAFAVSGVRPYPLRRRATVGLLLVTSIALAPTHELTPYLAASALVILSIFGQAPWWSGPLVGVPALGWAAFVHNVIASNFSFGQLFDLANLLPPKTVGVPGLSRSPAIGYESHALLVALLILIGLGLIGFLANIRTKWAWGYGLCPVVGVGLILVNPYGNEGIFRASLFAIPWIAVLAMSMRHPGSVVRRLGRPAVMAAGIAVVLLGLLATFIVAEWGDDGASILWRSDIAVTEYLRSRPARHAFVMALGAEGGTVINYPSFLVNFKTVDWATVAPQRIQDAKRLGPTDLVALTDSYGAVAVGNGASALSPLYIFWSSSTSVSSSAYGVQSVSQMNQWLRLLKKSPVWHVADRDGSSYMFVLR